MQANEYKNALDYLNKSLNQASSHNFNNALTDILRSKQKALENLGKSEQALQTLKRYRIVKDSILTSEMFTKLSKLEYRHNLEEERRKNEALRQENILQKQEIKKLQNKNLTRYLIAIILLIIIAGLLYLKIRYNKKNRELKLKQGELEFTLERLKQQENKTKGILNTLPDWVLLLNKQGDFTEIEKKIPNNQNHEWLNPSGNIRDIFPEKAVNKIMTTIEKPGLDSKAEIFDCELTHNNREKIYEARIIKVNENNYMLIARDMTLDRNSMAEITQSRQELAEMNKAKDRFLSILAHDLRDPFNSLLGFSNILHEDYNKYTEEEKKQFVKQIYKSSGHLFQLLVNLLHWTRLQTGKIQYSPHKQNLIKSIESAYSEIMEIASEKNIKITKDLPDDITIVHDPSMIQGAVQNLLSNAVKYSNRESNINLKAEQKNKEVIIEVTDEGIGIGLEEPEMLFRIDHQYKRAGTENETGTGLGLILCNEFVFRHNGYINIKTEKDNGSTFRIIIPESE